MAKFDSKNQNEIFLGYYSNSTSYGVCNLETMCVEESSDVVFDEAKVTMDVEIDYDDELEEVVVKAPTPP